MESDTAAAAAAAAAEAACLLPAFLTAPELHLVGDRDEYRRITRQHLRCVCVWLKGQGGGEGRTKGKGGGGGGDAHRQEGEEEKHDDGPNPPRNLVHDRGKAIREAR